MLPKQFSVFLDYYYWRSAMLIARAALVRQYRDSYLGMVWTVLQPMTMITVYAIVIPLLIRFPAQNYALYVLCTMPFWAFLSGSLISTSQTLLTRAEALKRCIISTTVYPLADVLRLIYTYVTSFTTMYIVAVAVGLPTSWYVLLLPLYLIPIFIAVISICVGISYVAPYLRDLVELIMVMMNVMSWFSAVPYPVMALPEKYRVFIEWNPFYILMEPIITLVYLREMPSLLVTAKLLGLMCICVATGYTLYKCFRRNFIYYL